MLVSKQDIPRIAKNALAKHLDRSASLLYSTHETICPGEVYFMGLNPGGDSGSGPRLEESIDASLTRTVNAYLVPWGNEVNDNSGKGEYPLQRRVQWLFQQLGLNLENTLCTNLVFIQSKGEKEIMGQGLEDDCWPVHEALLSIVKPRLILVYGNSGFSPFVYLHSRFGGEIRYQLADHGDWNLKAFKTTIDGRETAVVGLPHLSRYNPMDQKRADLVIQFIQANR